MLTMSTGGGGDLDADHRSSSTDVYKLLSDLYMQTCSVKVRRFAFFVIFRTL